MMQAPLSYAASEFFCSMYAEKAAAQAKQNIKYSCGYEGVRWKTDIEYYTQWCLNASSDAAERESIARIAQLGECNATLLPAGANRWCNTYSRIAVGQSRANLSSNCGFSGPAWSTEYGHHYRWCVGVSQERAVGEIKSRQHKLLNRCSG